MKQLENDRPGRIPGLDLLRILSMVMIIALHLLGQGGILEAAGAGTSAHTAAIAMECLFYCAVDCYGLLSGYLGGRGRPIARVLLLWVTVVIYSLLFACFFRWRNPELVGRVFFLRALFPVFTKQYWYFTGYFVLALLMPLLDLGFEKLSRVGARRAVAALLLLFWALPALLHSNVYSLRGGYSMLWLLLLYLLGRLLREDELFRRLGTVPLLFLAGAAYALTLVLTLRPMVLFGRWSLSLLGYTSPTMVLLAGCLVLLLSRRAGRGSRGEKLLAELSATSFGVYILHTNPLLWYLVFRPGCLAGWAALGGGWLVPAVIGTAAGVYLVFSAPEYLRLLLFRRLRLRQRLEALLDRLFPQREDRTE